MNDFFSCIRSLSVNIFNLLNSVEFPGLGVSCLVFFTTMYFLSRVFRFSDFLTHTGDVPDNSNNYIYKEDRR